MEALIHITEERKNIDNGLGSLILVPIPVFCLAGLFFLRNVTFRCSKLDKIVYLW